MTDTAPEVHGTPSPKTGGIKGFMHNETAGMPNWVWLLVIGGGIALAIGIKMYAGKKSSSSNAAVPDSGLGLAIDPTTGLPYAVEGLVPAGGTAGNTPPPNTITPPPPVFKWPDQLKGQIFWEGTGTHKIWFGPKGPQEGQVGQTELATLFPVGTTFTTTGGDAYKTGAELFYTLPGTTTPVDSGVKLVNPLAKDSGGDKGEHGGRPMTGEQFPAWPGGTFQTRLV